MEKVVTLRFLNGEEQLGKDFSKVQIRMLSSITRVDIEKLEGNNNFRLWQVWMEALPVH